MKFEDRYNLKEIKVGKYTLKQVSTRLWEYVHSKDKTTGHQNVIYVCFFERSESSLDYWGVCIQSPRHNDFIEFKTQKLERAISLAENYLQHTDPFYMDSYERRIEAFLSNL